MKRWVLSNKIKIIKNYIKNMIDCVRKDLIKSLCLSQVSESGTNCKQNFSKKSNKFSPIRWNTKHRKWSAANELISLKQSVGNGLQNLNCSKIICESVPWTTTADDNYCEHTEESKTNLSNISESSEIQNLGKSDNISIQINDEIDQEKLEHSKANKEQIIQDVQTKNVEEHLCHFCINHLTVREFTLCKESQEIHQRRRKSESFTNIQDKAEKYLQNLGNYFFKWRDDKSQKQVSAKPLKIIRKKKWIKKSKKSKNKLSKIANPGNPNSAFRRPSILEMSLHLSEIEKEISQTKPSIKSEFANGMNNPNLRISKNNKRVRLNTMALNEEYTKNQLMLEEVSEKSVSLPSECDETKYNDALEVENPVERRCSQRTNMSPGLDEEDDQSIISKSSKQIGLDNTVEVAVKSDWFKEDNVNIEISTVTNHRVNSLPKKLKRKMTYAGCENDQTSSSSKKKRAKNKKITIPDTDFKNFYKAYELHSIVKSRSSTLSSVKVSPYKNSAKAGRCNKTHWYKPDSFWDNHQSMSKTQNVNNSIKEYDSDWSSKNGFKINPMPTSNMISIISNLKDLENEIF